MRYLIYDTIIIQRMFISKNYSYISKTLIPRSDWTHFYQTNESTVNSEIIACTFYCDFVQISKCLP